MKSNSEWIGSQAVAIKQMAIWI